MENSKKKFKLFKDIEKNIRGVAEGMEFLEKIKYIKIKSPGGLKYYDFNDDVMNNYDVVDFNEKVNQLYCSEMIYRKIMIYNKLYNQFWISFDKIFKNYNYRYNDARYNYHIIFVQFLKGLRKMYIIGKFEFLIHKILMSFPIKIFCDDVTAEMFSELILNFIFELENNKCIEFDHKKFTIIFSEKYQEDLTKLMYCSFDLMFFGKNEENFNVNTNEIISDIELLKLVDNYSKMHFNHKMYTDDFLRCYVIASITDVINFNANINNLLLEQLQI